MPISDWKTIQEYEADLGHTRAQARYTNALAAEKEGESSTQKDFSELAKSLPPIQNMEEAESQLLQFSNLARGKGKLKLSGDLLKQSADVTKTRAETGKAIVEQRVKELEEQAKHVAQTAADAQALFDQAEASPGQADLLWNSHKMKLVDQGQPVDELPQSYREARSGLQLMAKQGVSAAEQMRIQATKLRDEEQANRNKVLNAQSKITNDLNLARTAQSKARTDYLKKQGVADKTNTELLKIKTLREAFLKEWPILPGTTKGLVKGAKASNLAGYQAVWDGDSWELVGQPPDWWKKSGTSTPNLPELPGNVNLDTED